MVAEKTPESPIDFTKDALELRIEGDYVSANGTTLGGDDGIAVAHGAGRVGQRCDCASGP